MGGTANPGQGQSGLHRFRTGAPLLASELNQIVDAVLTRMSGGRGLDMSTFGGSVVGSSPDQFISKRSLKQMQIQSDQGDFLVCRTLDANDVVGPADFNVLKPWTLRRTPFENLTVNGVAYTYSGNGARQADGTEDQVITQDYFLGAVIYIYQINISVEVTSGVFARYIDANVDGRAWCEPTS